MARISGIVMENENGKAVIMTPRGEFQRIMIDRHLEVGEVYHGRSMLPWKYAVAAVLILALSLGTVDFFSVKAYAQVSDSLELGINRWNLVVTTRALNDQGTAMLQQTKITGKKVDTAVEEIATQALTNGELEQDDKWKEFPVQASDKGNNDEEFIQRVEQNMNNGLQKAIEKRNKGNNDNNSNKNGHNNSNKNNNNNNDNNNNSNNSDKAKKDQDKGENRNSKDD